MLKTEKVAVSLPKTLIQRIEKLRYKMHVNRSKFYQMALRAYIREFPQEEDKKIAQLYREVNQTDTKLLNDFKKKSYKHLPVY